MAADERMRIDRAGSARWRSHPAWRWLRLAAALLLINFALSFHNVWPTPWITARPEISSEAAAIVLLIVVLAGLGALRPWLVRTTAIVMLLFAAARYMEVTAPALYGRAVNLYWDTRHLPAVAAMITESLPGWLIAASLIAAVAGIALLYRAFGWAIRTVAAARPRRPLAAVAALVGAAYLVGYYGSVLPVLQRFSIPVTQTYMRQIEFVAAALGGGEGAGLPAADPLARWQWGDAPPSTDVFVVFVESYGAVAYDAEEVSAVLVPHRTAFEATVESRDARVVSGYVTSPTFGGVSWLAHSSFMSGIDVTGSGAYNVLLTQARETLVDRFAAAGYRTLALMPGLKGDWPEGAFYGFDEIYGERAIAYAGPEFGWWRIPDQYSLARLDALEVRRDGRSPLFTFFPTINTHMPFHPVPPYQPDWQALTGPDPYPRELVGDVSAELPDFSELRAVYADALAYTLDYLAAWLGRLSEREFVLIVIGDHQPPASVAGQGSRWDVPVHVVASDGAVLATFAAAGFADGMQPPAAALVRTHELGALLLEALGATHAD